VPAPNTHADAVRFQVSGTDSVHLRAVGTLDGLVPLAIAGLCGPGSHRLRAIESNQIQFAAAGDGWGEVVTVAADGQVLLESEDTRKWIRVQVYLSSTKANTSALVRATDRFDADLSPDDVTAGEATAGDAATWTVDVYNAGSGVASGVIAWLDSTVEDLEISDDGVAWVSPTSESAGLSLGSILPGATTTLHLKRTIPAGADADAQVLNLINLSFDTL
jgi:hypothetical protein